MGEEKGRKIYIAGHTGLVGSALVRFFRSSWKSAELLLVKHSDLDLTRQKEVEAFLAREKPECVIIAAGRVGGVHTNARFPAEFAYENLLIEANLIHASWKSGVKTLLNFGASCIYPRDCPQPMSPRMLMSGKLEPTNEPYAVAKLMGLTLCGAYNRQYGTSYLTVIPSNLYGPGDSSDPERSHVTAAFLRKFHEAKERGEGEVTLWGSGEVKRDFLFIDDFAQACGLLLRSCKGGDPVNVGAEAPCTIKELALLVADVVKFKGRIRWDRSRPDGAPERILDASEIKRLGWSAKTDLRSGLEKTWQWFLKTGGEKCAS